MGKEEIQKLDEIVDLLSNLQNQVNFLQVQVSSGSGGSQSSGGRSNSITPSGGSSIDPKQLKNLENGIGELLEVANRNTEALYALREEFSQLISGKIEDADQRLSQVTSLLQQGLQFTEMGTHLTEIKDRLEEVITELATTSKNLAT